MSLNKINTLSLFFLFIFLENVLMLLAVDPAVPIRFGSLALHGTVLLVLPLSSSSEFTLFLSCVGYPISWPPCFFFS